jgi:D-serine deaminase-like pyridoxal phosphate-dependent protein
LLLPLLSFVLVEHQAAVLGLHDGGQETRLQCNIAHIRLNVRVAISNAPLGRHVIVHYTERALCRQQA